MSSLSLRTKACLRASLREDIGRGDATSKLLIPNSAYGEAQIIAREKGVLCGRPVLSELCRQVDRKLKISFFAGDGKQVKRNQVIATMKGRVHSILKVERTALNFLGHLSGIATQTRRFVDKVKGYPVLILDTRKTTPLWRELEKSAVRAGGGKNHRMGLYDAVFVKENHRDFGDLEKLRKIRGRFEIEVRNFTEMREALALHPHIILFDNFTPANLRRAVRYARKQSPQVILEASGGISLENVVHYAAMGVDWISVGALTHSVKSMNFSLLMK